MGFSIAITLVQASVVLIYSILTLRYLRALWWVIQFRETSCYEKDKFEEVVGSLREYMDDEARFMQTLQQLRCVSAYRVFSHYHYVIMHHPGTTKSDRQLIVAACMSPYYPTTVSELFSIGIWVFQHWVFWVVVTFLARGYIDLLSSQR